MHDAEPKTGDLVWATLSDPRGQNPKRRPVVILIGADQAAADEPMIAAAVTTTFPDPAPPTHVVLPHGTRYPHPTTGLKRRSAVVGSWLVPLPREADYQVMGRVPDATLLKVIECVQRLRG